MWFVPQKIHVCFSHLSNHETNMKYCNHQVGKEFRYDLILSRCIGKLMWDQITGPIVFKRILQIKLSAMLDVLKMGILLIYERNMIYERNENSAIGNFL